MVSAMRKYIYYLFSIFELLIGFKKPLSIVLIFLNLARSGVKTIRLRRLDLQFKVRGTMDVWSIKETFLDRFYEKYGYSIRPDWKVIDIGAGTGEFALFAAVALTQPDGRVFAFEPFPESCALMQENLQQNRINNVHVFTEAVSAEAGELELDLAGGEPLQFQSHHGKAASAETSLRVRSISLAGVLEKTELESCDLLKLDCEGAEYAILFAAPQSLIEQFSHIVMEYHDNVTQYTHRDMAGFLNQHGFDVDTFPNPVHPYLGYLRAMRRI
jgi:FkbM family methyltransferase